MSTNRNFHFPRLFAAFIISTVLFFAIFLTAYSLSYLNYKNINEQNDYIRDALEQFDSDLANLECGDDRLLSFSEQLDRVGAYIALLERRFGKYDSRVVHEKSLYNELQFKHYSLIHYVNDKCEREFSVFVMIYSNDPDYIDASESMGNIIGAFKQRDPGRYMVYSFDSSLDDRVSLSFIDQYNITRVPVIIGPDNSLVYATNIDDLSKFSP